MNRSFVVFAVSGAVALGLGYALGGTLSVLPAPGVAASSGECTDYPACGPGECAEPCPTGGSRCVPCCNGIPYDPELDGCCNGVLSPGNPDCLTFCNGVSYDPLTQGCCNGMIFDLATQVCCGSQVTAIDACCGGTPFDPEVDGCCDGSISPGNPNCWKECNGVLYDPLTQGCCNNTWIYDLVVDSCCEGGEFTQSSKTQSFASGGQGACQNCQNFTVSVAQARYEAWKFSLNTKTWDSLKHHYHIENYATLMPTVKHKLYAGRTAIKDYFDVLLPKINAEDGGVNLDTGMAISCGAANVGAAHGHYTFYLIDGQEKSEVKARFTFVWVCNDEYAPHKWRIVHHHSSKREAAWQNVNPSAVGTPQDLGTVAPITDIVTDWKQRVKNSDHANIAGANKMYHDNAKALPVYDDTTILDGRAAIHTYYQNKPLLGKNFVEDRHPVTAILPNDIAYHTRFLRFREGCDDRWMRLTFVFQKHDGNWKIMHHHMSKTQAN